MSMLCLCCVRFANVIVFLHRCVELCGEIKFTNEFVWHHILAGAHVDFENFTEFNKQTKTWKCRIDMHCIAIRACGFKVQIKCSARFISHSLSLLPSLPLSKGIPNIFGNLLLVESNTNFNLNMNFSSDSKFKTKIFCCQHGKFLK